MINSVSRILTLTKRNLKEIIRDPISLIFIIGLPLLMEVLFYLLFGGLTSQFEMKYLAPGIVVFSQAFLTLFIGLLISLDKSSAVKGPVAIITYLPPSFSTSGIFFTSSETRVRLGQDFNF